MVDLIAFKNEVTLIVKSLGKAVVTEILTAAEAASSVKHNRETEERLNVLVDGLCLEAVEKILKVVELSTGGREDAGSPQPDESEDASIKTQPTTESDPGGQSPSTEQSYLLVYRNTKEDSSCVLLSLLADAKTEGGSNSSSSGAAGEPSTFSDHEYARLSSSTTAPDGGGGSAAALNRKPGSRKTKKRTEAETHHECSQCGMLFPTPERLSDHQLKSHPVCSVCRTPFTGVLKLREHESREHGLLPYTCDYCPKRFNHKAHRDLHVKARHTGEKTCHCDICGKGYSCISVLKTHRMTHFEKTFICDVCGKSFYHACHLTRHKLVHQEVRPHQCSTCGRGFTQAANLQSHQLIHTGERQLCSICGKSYRCLKNHIISKHSHELPEDELPARGSIITCEVCGKKFPNPSQFKLHQRSHTGEKPFSCDICGKSYRLKELLRDHRYTHTGEKPYRCSLCSKTFNLATSFMRHRSIHSGATPYSCHDCGKHFRLLTFLKAHMQTKGHLKQMQLRQTGSPDN